MNKTEMTGVLVVICLFLHKLIGMNIGGLAFLVAFHLAYAQKAQTN